MTRASFQQVSAQRRRRLSALGALAVGMLLGPVVSGQEALLENPPFDQVILDEANDSAVLDVYPLDLPGRRVPTNPPGRDLTVRLLERPGQEFEISWNSIKTIKFYEQLLLERAAELTGQQKFDEAYNYFERLLSDYPEASGLDTSINRYLRNNALALFQQADFDRALALLGSLYDRRPDYPGLSTALNRVASEIIIERLRQQDYSGARAVLDLLTDQFGSVATEAIDEWEQRFRQAADVKVAEARDSLRAARYAEADRAARWAATIWPASSGADEVLRAIEQQHPQVTVGVFALASSNPVRKLDRWSDLRVSRLVHPTICQLEGFGEGGIYGSPYGEVSTSDTEHGRRLTLQWGTRATAVPPHLVARSLLGLADPLHQQYSRSYASLCQSVSLEGGTALHVDFHRPHVRPEALLLSASLDRSLAPGPFTIAAIEPDRMRLEITDTAGSQSGGVQTIIEQLFGSDEAAMTALVRGEVSLLDHVPPWHVTQLESAPGISLGRYLLPTVHVLVPNTSSKLLARREFRRALCFGIDRQRLLEQLICGGDQRAGFEVLSGPFPIGTSATDPVRYAYDTQLKPRAYSPRLAATLSLLAAAEVAKAERRTAAAASEESAPPDQPDETAEVENSEEPPPQPQVPELVLAHSSDVLARTVCQAIAQGLRQVGIPIELREYTADELASGELEYDLRYAELAMWEPVVDAHTLLGSGELVSTSAAMNLALRDLTEATNWVEVRQRLNHIHKIAHNDLPVVPLWQTVNYFAHRSDVVGVGGNIVTLYQHHTNWRINRNSAGN